MKAPVIGRGTRLFDGKDFFTIYDFVNAHEHFLDPEWDGDPVEDEICPECGELPCVCEKAKPPPCPECGNSPCTCEKAPCAVCGQRPCVCNKKSKIKVKLADGKEREIQHMIMTSYWHPDGTPMSAQEFMLSLFGELPLFFSSEEELRTIWSAPDTRSQLLEGLAEKGYGPEQLAEMKRVIEAEKSDLFDVLAYVAYTRPTLTREERAEMAKIEISTQFDEKQQAFLDFVLAHYVDQGVEELKQSKLKTLLRLKYNDSLQDAFDDLGPAQEIGSIFAGFQRYLYEEQTVA